MAIPAAVVTVSDSAHSGSREDLSGPAVAARLSAAGFEIVSRHVVADERAQIAALQRRAMLRRKPRAT
jgi:molybdopterin adenylyltransferase